MGIGSWLVRVLNDKRDRINPREVTLLILNQYFKKTKSLKDIINKYFRDYKFSELDRRFIFNIAKGTVRYYIKIDFIISLFSDKEIKSIDFIVLNILRMGIYQLMYMDRVPDYSTLNESVKLAKKNANLPSSKFVNAILRKISSVPDLNLILEEKIKEAGDETTRVRTKYSYPCWLVEYWLKWYGKEKTILILKSLNKNPLYYLRFNRGKISLEDLAREFDLKPVYGNFSSLDVGGGHDYKVIDVNKFREKYDKYENLKFLEEMLDDTVGVYSVQDISETEIYKKGLVTVQDLSSQLAVKHFLEPRKGDKILDICAAPGGKTSYIAEILENKGELISVDINGERLKVLRDNMARIGKSNIKVVEADATKPYFLSGSISIEDDASRMNRIRPDIYREYFDSILIDAPCSAFGTISKNPDAKYNKTIEDVKRLSGMSYRIMVNCDRYLKVGGRLVFYTCTLSPVENQQMIEKFLKEFKGKYIPKKIDFLDKMASILNLNNSSGSNYPGGCFEIMPYYFTSEAGFVCCMEKRKANKRG